MKLNLRLTAIVLVLVAVFTGGAFAQSVFNLGALRVVMTRAVYDNHYRPTPMQAHYILDEQNGAAVCSRVLYHENGQFAVSEMPLAFCGR